MGKVTPKQLSHTMCSLSCNHCCRFCHQILMVMYVFTDFFLSILCKTADVKTNVDILLSFKLFLMEKNLNMFTQMPNAFSVTICLRDRR